MAITLNKTLVYFAIIISSIGCYTTKETITICGRKYDVYKETEYDYEQKLNSTVNIICFRNSKLIAFAYQSSGFRNNDSNLVHTIIKHQNDSLLITTIFQEQVYGYPYQATRYYRCLKNGIVILYRNGNPDFIITKKSARRNKNKMKNVRLKN